VSHPDAAARMIEKAASAVDAVAPIKAHLERWNARPSVKKVADIDARSLPSEMRRAWLRIKLEGAHSVRRSINGASC
jgi:hypothetical protein